MAQAGYAAAGLEVVGGLLEAKGKAEGYKYSEEKARRQAAAARTAADETTAQLTDELSTTLGNIQAIRAAAGADSASPTALAIMGKETEVAERQRRIQVGNLYAQAEQSELDRRYFRSAASSALLAGTVGAFARGAKTLAATGKK